MEITASGFKFRANALKGRKRFPISQLDRRTQADCIHNFTKSGKQSIDAIQQLDSHQVRIVRFSCAHFLIDPLFPAALKTSPCWECVLLIGKSEPMKILIPQSPARQTQPVANAHSGGPLVSRFSFIARDLVGVSLVALGCGGTETGASSSASSSNIASTGGTFSPAYSTTKSLTSDAPFLNSTNSRLFTGCDPGVRFDDLKITID